MTGRTVYIFGRVVNGLNLNCLELEIQEIGFFFGVCSHLLVEKLATAVSRCKYQRGYKLGRGEKIVIFGHPIFQLAYRLYLAYPWIIIAGKTIRTVDYFSVGKMAEHNEKEKTDQC